MNQSLQLNILMPTTSCLMSIFTKIQFWIEFRSFFVKFLKMQLLQKYFGFIVQSLEAKAKQAVCSAVVVVFFNCMLA